VARPRKYPPELLDRGDVCAAGCARWRRMRACARICRPLLSARRSGRCARRSTSCAGLTRCSRPPLGPHPRRARRQLLRLRLPADVQGPGQGRRDGSALSGAASHARARDHLGQRRGWPWRTTRPDPEAHRRPDLVGRDFTPAGPDELWVADLSNLRCCEGLVFFAVVIDVYSRRVVGWQLASHVHTTLVLDALRMALGPPPPRCRRRPGASQRSRKSIHEHRLHRHPRRPTWQRQPLGCRPRAMSRAR
jgi:transposase InsO family protein